MAASPTRGRSAAEVLARIAITIVVAAGFAFRSDTPVRAAAGASEHGGGPGRPAAFAPGDAKPVVLAYYYIWFEPQSWVKNKTDLPTLGGYTSSDPAIIRQHVAWAKAAGIDALIVSWKHEPRLDGPLQTLVDAAREQGIHLVLLYQGLDFFRKPIKVDRITADLAWFMEQYGTDPVFNVFGRPTVIFSGTPSYDRASIARMRAALDGVGPAYLLGSEREAATYTALSGLLDGDAYYWSSVDPSRDRNYKARLQALADAIRADHGLWLAPVAPGFDARLIGGSRIVDRADGATYRTEWKTALSTSPDGLAIISWNEFSENSYIEPSATYGTRYLEVTAELVRDTLGRPAATDPAAARPAASAPAASVPAGSAPATAGPTPSAGPRPPGPGTADGSAGMAALLVGLLVIAPVIVLAIRARKPAKPRDPTER